MNNAMLKKLTGGAFCEEAYDFAVSSAREAVLNYCNISEVPAGLENTVIKIASDILRTGQYGSGDAPSFVTRVEVGDTATSFKPISDNETGEILKNYTKTLNRYRRITF